MEHAAVVLQYRYVPGCFGALAREGLARHLTNRESVEYVVVFAV